MYLKVGIMRKHGIYLKRIPCISIDYFLINKNYDYAPFRSKSELQEFLNDKVHEGSIEPDFINRFVNKVNVGDIFIAHKGRSTLAGIGVVESDYIYQDDVLKHIRKINWFYTPDDLELKDGSFKTNNVVRLNELYSKFVNEIFARIAGKDKNVRRNLLKYLFNQYYTHYHTSEKVKIIQIHTLLKRIIFSIIGVLLIKKYLVMKTLLILYGIIFSTGQKVCCVLVPET